MRDVQELKDQMLREPPRKIAIFRALQLGDLMQAVPAFRAIRRQFPGAEITLIGLPWARSFVQRFHRYLDRFVEFKGYPGLIEVEHEPLRTLRFIDEQREEGYDLVIQMHGSGGSSNPFVLTLGGKITVGYYEGERPDGLTLALPYPQGEPERLRNLGLSQVLDRQDLKTDLEFPLEDQDHQEADQHLQTFASQAGPLIGLHPGSRSPARRWPLSYFATLADLLIARLGAKIFVTGGPGEEESARMVCQQMREPSLCLGGKTSLGGLGALIKRSDLFISNDTGPAHLADALRAPSIVLFGPADLARWAPLDRELHRVMRRDVSCSPCNYQDCPIDHRCLRWIFPMAVFQEATGLLKKGMVQCAASTS